jgi:hypothetical protein
MVRCSQWTSSGCGAGKLIKSILKTSKPLTVIRFQKGATLVLTFAGGGSAVSHFPVSLLSPRDLLLIGLPEHQTFRPRRRTPCNVLLLGIGMPVLCRKPSCNAVLKANKITKS